MQVNLGVFIHRKVLLRKKRKRVMRVSSIEQQIKNFVLTQCRMDKVGIASIDRFNESPEGFHPTDFLPGCKSVVSFCTRLPDGAVETPFRAFEDMNLDVHAVYGAFGYVGAPNYNLLFANYKLARFIEELTGEIAMPNTAGPTHGAKMMSMRHCAFAAGLGEFGWNSLMLTPEYGPRNRFGAVLTTAELKPDPMYSGERLCDPSKCQVCVEMCPVGAIPPYKAEEARWIKTGDKEISYSQISWAKCRIMCHGTHALYNEEHKDLIPQEFTEVISADINGPIAKGIPLKQNFWQHGATWKCGNCLTYCPVGNWHERFQDTGLSNVDIDRFIKE